MPTFYVHTPVGVNQIEIRQHDSRGCGGGDEARQTSSEFGGFDYRPQQRRQSGRRDSELTLPAI